MNLNLNLILMGSPCKEYMHLLNIKGHIITCTLFQPVKRHYIYFTKKCTYKKNEHFRLDENGRLCMRYVSNERDRGCYLSNTGQSVTQHAKLPDVFLQISKQSPTESTRFPTWLGKVKQFDLITSRKRTAPETAHVLSVKKPNKLQ